MIAQVIWMIAHTRVMIIVVLVVVLVEYRHMEIWMIVVKYRHGIMDERCIIMYICTAEFDTHTHPTV